MKKVQLKCSIISTILCVFLCVSCKPGDTLPEVTKPYLGEYECKRAVFGETDYMQAFDYVRLTLNPDDTFTLAFQKKGGNKQEESGAYAYDLEKKEIVLFGEDNTAYHRRFPLKDGKITIVLGIGTSTFIAEFEQK